MSTNRARAAAARTAGPNIRVLSEPNVPMSHGQESVSPMTMWMASRGTLRSSAAICVRDVITPCPISIFPENRVTFPSGAMCRYALMSSG